MKINTTYTNNLNQQLEGEINNHIFNYTYSFLTINDNHNSILFYTKSILYKEGGEILLLLYKEGIALDKFPLDKNDSIFAKIQGNTLPVILNIFDEHINRIEPIDTESSIKFLDKKKSILLNDIEFLIGMFLYENYIYTIEEKRETNPLHIYLKPLYSVEVFLKKHNLDNIFFDFH